MASLFILMKLWRSLEAILWEKLTGRAVNWACWLAAEILPSSGKITQALGGNPGPKTKSPFIFPYVGHQILTKNKYSNILIFSFYSKHKLAHDNSLSYMEYRNMKNPVLSDKVKPIMTTAVHWLIFFSFLYSMLCNKYLTKNLLRYGRIYEILWNYNLGDNLQDPRKTPLGEFSKSFTRIDCVGIKRIRVIRPKLDP